MHKQLSDGADLRQNSHLNLSREFKKYLMSNSPQDTQSVAVSESQQRHLEQEMRKVTIGQQHRDQ